MQTIQIKGLKPLIIKYLAMLMGICYLMHPLQEQVGGLFHNVAHVLEMPESVFAHNNNHTIDAGIHKSQDHTAAEMHHKHLFLELINAAFADLGDEPSPKELPPLKVKIDKHITSLCYQIKPCFAAFKRKEFHITSQKATPGHFTASEKPPNHLLV